MAALTLGVDPICDAFAMLACTDLTHSSKVKPVPTLELAMVSSKLLVPSNEMLSGHTTRVNGALDVVTSSNV